MSQKNHCFSGFFFGKCLHTTHQLLGFMFYVPWGKHFSLFIDQWHRAYVSKYTFIINKEKLVELINLLMYAVYCLLMILVPPNSGDTLTSSKIKVGKK